MDPLLGGLGAATAAAALWVLDEMRAAEHVPGMPMEGPLRRAHFDAVMRGVLAVGEPLYWFAAIPGIQLRLVNALWTSQVVSYGKEEHQKAYMTFPGGGAPEKGRSVCPRVMFVHGGAWAIGAPWQYVGASRALADACGRAVLTPAYGLWPRGTIPSMALDVLRALDWAVSQEERGEEEERAEEVAGEKGEGIVLVGHSAGAHLVLFMLCELAAVAAGADETTACETVDRARAAALLRKVRGFVSLSGPFCPSQHLDFEASRGSLPLLGNVAEGSPMSPAAGGVGGLAAVSLSRIFADRASLSDAAVRLLPPMVLYHGTEDGTVAPSMTTTFATIAQRRGCTVAVRIVPGADHMMTTLCLMRDDGTRGEPSRAVFPHHLTPTFGPAWDIRLHVPGAGHSLPPATDADLSSAIIADVRTFLFSAPSPFPPLPRLPKPKL
jgi:acetyl esterase/lipase